MKKLVFTAVLIAAMAPSRAPAVGGCTSSGCGGNFSATEFKDIAADAISALRSLRAHGPVVLEVERYDNGKPEKRKVEIDPEALKAAFRSVSVVDGQLYLDGKVVSFKSDPQAGHVDFSEQAWESHTHWISRVRMVIHELLMLASRNNPELDDYLYDEQLSRSLARLVTDEEIKVAPRIRERYEKRGFFCLMVFQPGSLFDVSYRRDRMFAETSYSAEAGRDLLVRDCQLAWPKKKEECRVAAFRCEEKEGRQYACTFRAGVDSPVDYLGLSDTRLEGEFRARRSCLSGSPWKQCLDSNPDPRKPNRVACRPVPATKAPARDLDAPGGREGSDAPAK